MRFSEPVQLSIITAISGVVIAYIVNVTAKRVQDKKAEKQPKDRMEQMFDGYERLIRQKDAEDDRKQKYIKVLEKELHNLQVTLTASRDENAELHKMLEDMRKEYKTVKGKNNVVETTSNT